ETNCVAISPNGRTVAVGGSEVVRLFQARCNAQEHRTFSGRTPGLSAVALSPDGQRLATATTGKGTGQIKVWDPKKPAEPVWTRASHKGPADRHGVTALAFCPDGKQLASGGSDRTVRVWNLLEAKDKAVHEFAGAAGPISALAFTPDG